MDFKLQQPHIQSMITYDDQLWIVISGKMLTGYKVKMSATNLWNSSSENTLILFFANILVFVVCFENMFHFFFHSGLAMEPVYQFLQENPQDR